MIEIKNEVNVVKRILMGETQKAIAIEFDVTLLVIKKLIIKVCSEANEELFITMPKHGYMVAGITSHRHKQIFRLSKELTYRGSIVDWLREHRSQFFTDLPSGESEVKERLARDIEMVKLILEGRSFSEVGVEYGITKSRVHQVFHHYCRKVMSSRLASGTRRLDVLKEARSLIWLRLNKKYIACILDRVV